MLAGSRLAEKVDLQRGSRDPEVKVARKSVQPIEESEAPGRLSKARDSNGIAAASMLEYSQQFQLGNRSGSSPSIGIEEPPFDPTRAPLATGPIKIINHEVVKPVEATWIVPPEILLQQKQDSMLNLLQNYKQKKVKPYKLDLNKLKQ